MPDENTCRRDSVARDDKNLYGVFFNEKTWVHLLQTAQMFDGRYLLPLALHCARIDCSQDMECFSLLIKKSLFRFKNC